MDRAIAAEAPGQFVPLTAGAEAEDDAINRSPPVDARSSAELFGRGWGILQKNGFNDIPEVIGEFPDGLQLLDVSGGSSQGWFS
jgi:hypothetical protein